MYFEIFPKNFKKDLFNSDVNLNNLLNLINDTSVRLIVIKGLRRTGKTSLLNVAIKESDQIHIKIDVRNHPFFNYNDFLNVFMKLLKNTIFKKNVFKQLYIKLDSIDLSLSYGDIKLNSKFNLKNNKEISLFLEEVNNFLEKKKLMLVISIDEVQLLKKIKIDYLFASIYDNYKNIKFILTGSEIGLLDSFLGVNNYDAPLYGRHFEVIEIKKLREQDSFNFLKIGFNQVNKVIDNKEIVFVVERLDGVIGWLTQYGYERIKGKSRDVALNNVISNGVELCRREFNNFLDSRKEKDNYITLMHFLNFGLNSWSDMKKEFIRKGKKISDTQLGLYLNNLKDYGFIAEKNKKYFIPDPLLEKIFS